jgi:hypothetical protein
MVYDMTIMEMPRICGTEKLRLYDGNKVVAETWINGASVTSFVEENLVLKQYANREIDYIEICIEGCISESLVMEIYLK